MLKEFGRPARHTRIVGDRLAADVHLAKRAGMAGALILTGATTLDEALRSEDRSDYIIGGLGELLPSKDGPGSATRAEGG